MGDPQAVLELPDVRLQRIELRERLRKSSTNDLYQAFMPCRFQPRAKPGVTDKEVLHGLPRQLQVELVTPLLCKVQCVIQYDSSTLRAVQAGVSHIIEKQTSAQRIEDEPLHRQHAGYALREHLERLAQQFARARVFARAQFAGSRKQSCLGTLRLHEPVPCCVAGKLMRLAVYKAE